MPARANLQPKASAPTQRDPTKNSLRALSLSQCESVRSRLQELLDSGKFANQRELAKAVRIAQQTLNRVLLGDPVGFYVAQRLAEYEGVQVWAILDGGPATFEATVRSQRRWSDSTTSAVREYAKNSPKKYAHYGEGDWIRFLDLIEEALMPLLALGSRKVT